MTEALGADSATADAQSARLRVGIAAAIADVEAVGLTDGPDRAVALAVLLAARLGLLPSVSAPPTPVHPAAPADSATVETALPSGVAGSPLSRLAARMKLPAEVIELVYDMQNGDLGVVLSARRLAEDKANATRQLAQIVVAGRQAAELEEWTPVGIVRQVVTDYGRFDSSNFAACIAKLDNVFVFRGKGTNRELKVTRPGMEIVAELVKTLAGSTA